MKTIKLTSLTIILISSFFFFSQKVNAQSATILFQDDFSTGFTKWEPVRDNGWPWIIVDGKAEAYINRGSTITEMVPKDQYWDPTWGNMEYQLEFTPLEGTDQNISFSFNSLLSWYEIHFAGGSVSTIGIKNSRLVLKDSSSYRLENGTTYLLKIRMERDRLTILINDQVFLDVPNGTGDTIYGKIGIKASTGSVYPTRVQFDNIVVRSLDAPLGKNLNVNIFKQLDPLWKDQEYDHATAWSQKPIIGRWGCTVTSLAMIMNYHGLTSMPDGSTLNPSSLNAWFQSQPDGYVGDGLLNWIAGTRLTRILHELNGTPKLEYGRTSGDQLTQAIDEINNDKPVILQTVGHFLVGDGLTADESDIRIKDPAYDLDLFSQHNSDLLSTITFKPSLTDLGYLLLTHQPSLQVTLRDENGTFGVTDLQTFSDQISDPLENSGETTPARVLHQLAKPSGTKYLVEIKQASLTPFELEILAYDDQANPTMLNQAGIVGNQPIVFEITYDKNGSSSLTKTLNFTQIRRDLEMLKDNKDIKKSYVFSRLDRVARLGEEANAYGKQRYLTLFQKYFENYKKYFTANGRDYLDQQLVTLNNSL